MFHKNFGPDPPQLFETRDLDDTIFPLGVTFLAFQVISFTKMHTFGPPSLGYSTRSVDMTTVIVDEITL